jgi:CheY-like chemotaxis protein
MSSADHKVLAVMNDLFFSVQIMDAAKKLGLTVEFLKDKETVLEKVKDRPSLVIFDLNYAAADPLDLIRRIKADAATADVRTFGFISHVQIEIKRQAEESGCDTVVARSVFAKTLPDILRRHTA